MPPKPPPTSTLTPTTPNPIHTLWITLWTTLPLSLALLFSASLLACGATPNALSGTTDADLLGGSLPGDFLALLEASHTHWDQRDQPDHLRAAIDLYQQALNTASPDLPDAERRHAAFTLCARLARAYFLLGDAVLPLSEGGDSRDAKAAAGAAFDQGRAYAERALALLHPPLLAAAQSGQDLSKAIAAIDDPNAAGPMFWWAANLGRWMESQNPFAALSLTSDLERVSHRAYALDPTYFHASTAAFLGGFYTRLPLPSGDAAKSKQYFDEATSCAPHMLAHRVAFATLYAPKVKDKALATRLLQGVLDADPNAHPDTAPENRLEQRRAQRALSTLNDLF
jgi:tetratricopeptide (TPR) repeat protein